MPPPTSSCRNRSAAANRSKSKDAGAGFRSKNTVWITDESKRGESHRLAVSVVLVHTQTRFQRLAIVETLTYGKALILDANLQSCVADEFLCHQPLVQAAMILHHAPRYVAILGGERARP